MSNGSILKSDYETAKAYIDLSLVGTRQRGDNEYVVITSNDRARFRKFQQILGRTKKTLDRYTSPALELLANEGFLDEDFPTEVIKGTSQERVRALIENWGTYEEELEAYETTRHDDLNGEHPGEFSIRVGEARDSLPAILVAEEIRDLEEEAERLRKTYILIKAIELSR